MSSPVSIEKQQAVLQGLRKHTAGARLSFRSCQRSEMHPPSKRKAQLAVERDSRMVRTEDMQERDFAPHCYR
jgi:hypothetical protein